MDNASRSGDHPVFVERAIRTGSRVHLPVVEQPGTDGGGATGLIPAHQTNAGNRSAAMPGRTRSAGPIQAEFGQRPSVGGDVLASSHRDLGQGCAQTEIQVQNRLQADTEGAAPAIFGPVIEAQAQIAEAIEEIAMRQSLLV